MGRLVFFCVILLLGLTESRPLGVVSSVWTSLLPNFTVPELVGKLSSLGVTYIELRQGTLPGFEDSSLVPNATALSNLVASFPAIRFSYAVSLPIFSSPFSSLSSPLFSASLQTSHAIASHANGAPFLRLVDVTSTNISSSVPSSLISAALSEASSQAATLALRLSVENAAVPWDEFWATVVEGTDEAVWVVYDACNLAWKSDGNEGPFLAVKAAQTQVAAANTLLLHAKQLKAPSSPILPVVTDGAMNWSALAMAFNKRLPNVPVLLEISSSLDLWNNIRQSVQYLKTKGFDFSQ